MSLAKKTVSDVENMFDFLLGVIALAKGGQTQEIEDGAFDYSKMLLEAAEKPMKDLDLYDKIFKALNEAERLVLNDDFITAYKTLQRANCELMQKSGTIEQLRNHLNKLH
jgi:hypothetical protein